MNIARTIVAVFIAASVAMLPVAGGALAANSKDMSISSMGMTHSNDMSISMGMSDCCPHDSAPCYKTNSDCASMAACAGAVLSFCEPIFAHYVFPLVLADVLSAPDSRTLRSYMSSPPFRPPRV